MMILDAHFHLWRYTPEEYGWIPDAWAELRRDFVAKDADAVFAMAGVSGAIAVQARRCVAETEFLLGETQRSQRIRGVVGWVDLLRDDVAEQLARFSAESRLKGVREVLQGEPDEAFFGREEFHRGLRAVARCGLNYDLLVYAPQLRAAIACADRHPELTFVLDHGAKPPIARGAFPATWAADLRELARRPNVWCKLSGLATEVRDAAWDADLLRPYFETLLESFGARRLMFGSDWPVCLARTRYDAWRDAVAMLVAALSPDERARIWHGSAAEAYRLT